MNNFSDKKIPVIAVVGATASGKTAVAIELAKRYNAEIVSADSMQIYKGMDIASAKPSVDEMQGIKHHLIDFLDPSIRYSVARYKADAENIIKQINSRGKNVIVCGGTGLYIDSLLQNIIFEDEPDNKEVRDEIRHRRETEGIEVLYRELVDIDPDIAKTLHINNEGRILRALESYYLTGEKPSVLRLHSKNGEALYDCVYIGLQYSDREILYDRINRRVDIMIANGLVEEAREYFSRRKEDTAAQAIGHKELVPYLLGEISLEEATENLKRVTRNYAKRQLTWFRRNSSINNIFCDKYENFDAVIDSASYIIDKSGLFGVGE